jgi:hypothetical protein
MRTAKLLAVASLLVLSACAADRKHARSSEGPIPESTSGASDKSDMPDAPAAKGAPAESAPADATPAKTESLAIKIAPMKLTPAKKGKTVEVKKDGTITADGKPVAKIAGDQIDALDGSGTLVTVSMDGSLVGQALKPGFKLDGDKLVSDKGYEVTVGDDGTITSTKDGKSETLAKVEGGADAKRTAVLVTTVLVAKPTDAPAAAAAAPAKGAPAAKKK